MATIVALAAAPLLMTTAMGIDYGIAVDSQAKLNSYADAAALAAVTPTLMTQTDSASTTAAQNAFNSQASALSTVTYTPSSLNVTVADSGGTRTVTVAYKAAYKMFFPSILGMSAINLVGSSSATAGMAPNINFYLLLDSSPSMGIAATQAGINTMVANTSPQGGCAFACHETFPAGEYPALGNPNHITCVGDSVPNQSYPIGGEDNYALARCLGVTLRIDLLQQAAQNLIITAQNKEAQNSAKYNMGFYSFDVNFNTLQTLTPIPSSASGTAVASPAYTAASSVQMLTVWSNNMLTATYNNNDADTNSDAGLAGVNTAMPNPGSGTTTNGDTPQEVLFLVTDGVEDEMVGGYRQQSLMNTATCTTIKNRGIRIAVLYTEYLPLPTNAWYDTYIAGFQPNIASNLQSCASTGLFYEVQTGGDISAALTSLFQLAVQSAYLSK